MKRRTVKILIITTSEVEFEFIQQTFETIKSLDRRHSVAKVGGMEFMVLRSDPGIFSLAWYLTSELKRDSYDMAINVGICGSFMTECAPGYVFRVRSDLFADIGTEDGKDLFEMGLLDPNVFPFTNGRIWEMPGDFLKVPDQISSVDAITVNRVSKSDENIAFLKTRYKPGIETMEGAMFFYICSMEKLNFIQLRAVSNQVGVRDKSEWEIEKAMKALVEVLKLMIS